MPEIQIRPATSADYPHLSLFEHNYQTTHVWQMERSISEGQVLINFREIRLPRTVEVQYPRRPAFEEKNSDAQMTILAAVLGGVPVGYVRLSEKVTPDCTWVYDLVVRKDLRKMGIAKALMLAAYEWGAVNRLRRVVIEMQSKNYPAVKFAQQMGFEFSGYNDHYYHNQDIALFFAKMVR